MAESFKSFNTSIAVTNHNAMVLIPSGLSGSNTESYSIPVAKTNTRDAGSIAQIHSIYITQRATSKIQALDRYNPSNFSAFNLYIDDLSKSGYKIYVVYDGRIIPGSPFFIEKNITLEPSQRLVIECPSDSYDYNSDNNTTSQLNTQNNIYLDISASVVLFPSSN